MSDRSSKPSFAVSRNLKMLNIILLKLKLINLQNPVISRKVILPNSDT